MDAAGKDGTIKHVMSGVNPQGVQVTLFKAPGPEELDHDFLWRVIRAPAGARAHRHLQPQPLRGGAGGARASGAAGSTSTCRAALIGKKLWQHRLDDIAAFERYLARQGTVVLKFFLHVSKEEQKRRFLARLDEPDKNWKFSASDLTERAHWDDYMDAYEEAIAATARRMRRGSWCPPTTNGSRRLIVVAAMIEALEALDLHVPQPTAGSARQARRGAAAAGGGGRVRRGKEGSMSVRVARWGNSLGVRIPRTSPRVPGWTKARAWRSRPRAVAS